MLVHFSACFLLRIIVSMPRVIQVVDAMQDKGGLHFSLLCTLILSRFRDEEFLEEPNKIQNSRNSK